MSKLTIKTKFATVPTSLLNDPKISLKAKGIYGFMQSKPDNWEFTVNGLENQLLEGREAIRAALVELQDAGYLVRINYKNDKGQWDCDYELFERPNRIQSAVNAKPVTENPFTVHPSGKTRPLSKIDINKIESKIEEVKKESKEKIKEKKFDAEIYVKKLDLEETVKGSLLDLIEVRKFKRTATTQKSIDLIIENLQKWHAGDTPRQVLALKKSIMNGWTGVFEYQESKNFNQQKNKFYTPSTNDYTGTILAEMPF